MTAESLAKKKAEQAKKAAAQKEQDERDVERKKSAEHLRKVQGSARLRRETVAAPAKTPSPASSPRECQHDQLHFERGGFLVVCSNPDCKKAWQAMNPERLIPDFFAMNQGLSELDVRKNPLPHPL